jgi:hypothetical protein
MLRQPIADFGGPVLDRDPQPGDVVRETVPRDGGPDHVVEYIWTPQAPAPPPEPEPRRIKKIDFERLYTTSETVAFNVARRQVASLVIADYADPAKAALVGFEIFLRRYDMLDTIELDHPDTVQGMQLAVALGIVTPARAAEILATQP